MIGKAVNGVKWTQNRTRQKPEAVVSCHSRVEQNIQASAPASLGSTDRKPGGVSYYRGALSMTESWLAAAHKVVLPSWNWIGKDLMGLKAFALSVMESDSGENARKLWKTEGLTGESDMEREILHGWGKLMGKNTFLN